MKKLIFLFIALASFASYGQSSLYGNAVFNVKDPRNTSIYKLHYLNNTDSILTIDSVGINFIRAARFKGGTTAQRPAFAVAGMMRYNSDSAKLEYYNGSAWGSLAASTSASYNAGSGLTLTGSDFKLGGTISENTTLNTGGTYTFSLTDGTTPMIYVDANERVSIKGTNNSGNQFYVNGTMGAADGSVLFSFASASLQYYCPSSDMIIRLNGQSEEWRLTKGSSEFVFYPVTTNADPYRIKDNALNTIYEVDFANKLNKINYVPVATTNDTKLVVRGSSDSAFRQLDFPIVQTSYTPTRGDVTNIASASVTTSYYSREGNKIEVWGEFTIDPTATGDTQITLSLPIASSITNSYDLSGSAVTYDNNQTFRIYFGGGNAIVRGNASVDASSHTYSYRYVYYYIAP